MELSRATASNSSPAVAIFNFLGLSALVLASWLLGARASTRERCRTVASLRDRAEALERERDRFAELAAEQEARSRISREMHDVKYSLA